MRKALKLTFGFFLLSLASFAQTDKQKVRFENVIMTWNKNTPEQEMQDDIKALNEYGVTIKYANIKRNDKNEITGIDVSFEDKEGNKGSLSYNQNKPISTIKFYKQDNEIGFGEPSNVFDSFAFSDKLIENDKMEYGFKYLSPGEKSNFKSRTMIKREDREPLVIEDGKVIEGGNDYSKEEIDEILKRNDADITGKGDFKPFNYKGNQDYSEQLQHIQKQLDELKKMQESAKVNDSEQSKEKTEKNLKKTKASLKTQKA